ncbi:MAG: SRPBCC domain-containing protein [Alphaproteobacteria bacterium]|nr:MAG: SRPBCC domain-containing protein [Alphaproteobacteria bacterium]
MEQSTLNMEEHKHSSEESPLVIMTRFFNAPVEWVWKAWSDPEIIEQWWGPTGYTSKYACMEFREGGKYFFDMEGSDGKVIWSTGTYEEIIPYEKIVCTDSFADKDGNIIFGNDIGMKGNWPKKMYITIEFEKIDEHQSKLVITQEGVPKIAHDESVEGWNQSLDKFQLVVERYGDENLKHIH